MDRGYQGLPPSDCSSLQRPKGSRSFTTNIPHPCRPGEFPVESIRKSLFFFLTELFGAGCDAPGLSEVLHEVADGEPLSDIPLSVEFTAGIDDGHSSGNEGRCQGDILGDGKVMGLGVLGDVFIHNFWPNPDANGGNIVGIGHADLLVGDKNRRNFESPGRSDYQLLDRTRTGIRVHPYLHAQPPKNDSIIKYY